MANRDASKSDRRRRAVHFVKMVAAASVAAAALGALVWYGDGHQRERVAAFLSPPFVSTLNHRDWDGFVRHLDRLPSIDTADAEGITTLIAVIACGSEDECAYVLSRGADVNGCQYGRGTPLMLALNRGRLNVARMLLERGADANRVSSQGDTPLLAAVRGGHVDNVELILPHVTGDLMPAGIFSNPLDGLGSDGDDDQRIARLLLSAGVNPNRMGRNGRLPLVSAALEGALPYVALLLSCGADPDLKDGLGRTARDLPMLDSRMAEALRGDADRKDGCNPIIPIDG